MRPVSDQLLGIVQASHIARCRVTVVTGFPQTTTPTGTQLTVIAGDVRMDSSATVRATLDCTVIAPWGSIIPNGTEVFVEYGVDIAGGATEWVSLGYFGVETVTQDGANGPLRITGSDRMGRVNRTDNSWNYVAPSGTSHDELFRALLYGSDSEPTPLPDADQTLGVGGIDAPAPGAGVTLVSADSTSQLHITSSGIWDGQGHTVKSILIEANDVTVQNFYTRGGTGYGIYSIGTGNTIQNCDIARVSNGGTGDINGITAFGDDTSILFNKIGVTEQLVSGDPGDSHTDGIQVWHTSSKPTTSNMLIKGNRIVGPISTSDPRYLHQGITAEGDDATSGGGGGTGDSTNWTIDGNYFATAGNQVLELRDIQNVIITRNTFAGHATKIVNAADGTTYTYYNDNVNAGIYGSVGVTVTTGSGPGITAPDPPTWFDEYPGVFPPSVTAEAVVFDYAAGATTLSYDLPIDREYGEILRKVAADHDKRLFFDYRGRLNVVDEEVEVSTETSVVVVSAGGAGAPTPTDPPVGQTTNFTEGFASGLAAWNSVQTHTYDDDAADYDLSSADYRLQVVGAGAFHPNVLRTEVHDGDTAVGSHERSEISGFGKTPMLAQPGDEKWYEFDVRFGDPDWDPEWDSEDDWLIFFQWHHVGETDDAPPLALSVHNDNVVYFEREADDVIQPFLPVWTVRPGAWEKVIIHVKWSTNPAVGFVHAYVNGTEVVPKTLCQTLHADDTDDTYPKCGQYRRNTVGGTTVVMHDNIRISTLPQTSPTTPTTTTTTVVTTTGAVAPAVALSDLSRQVTLDGVYNAARVTGEQPVEGDPPWGAAWNNSNYGIGRQQTFGNVTKRFSSPILTSPAACEAAAITIRDKVKGLKYSASFATVPNPALEPLDVITLRFPSGGPAGTLPQPGAPTAVEELHVIDTLTFPLSGGLMQVTTRDGWVTG